MHFLTIVFGDTPYADLARYQETSQWREGADYLVFDDVEDEYRERYLIGLFDEPWVKQERPEQYRKPLRLVFPTFDDYMAVAYHFERDERTGRYGEWCNPRSTFDWCVTGGRFANHFVLKPTCRNPDATSYHAKKEDLDTAAMSRVYYQELLSNWDNLDRKGKTGDAASKFWLDIPESIGTREQLVRFAQARSIHNAPVAAIIDGAWFGPWWMMVGITVEAAAVWDAWYSSRFAAMPDETPMTVIDCHAV